MVWCGVLATVIVLALVTDLIRVIQGGVTLPDENPAPTLTRVVRFFSYFTVQSNILVAITVAALAFDPDRDGPGWRVLRIAGLYGITVTGLVYVWLLRDVVDLTGVAVYTNIAFHYFAPAAAVIGWLAFGPRPRIDQDTLLRSLAWPAGYVAYSVIHGAASDWYPYPFIDVTELGYAVVIRNGIVIIGILLAVGALYRAGDTRLRRTDPAGPGSGARR